MGVDILQSGLGDSSEIAGMLLTYQRLEGDGRYIFNRPLKQYGHSFWPEIFSSSPASLLSDFLLSAPC